MIRFKKLPENIHTSINTLAEFFNSDPNIVFAYLFGGLVKEKQNLLSDLDVAVYIKNIKKLDLVELYGKITDILGTDEVDLVVLNTSPISLTGRILQNRKLLTDKAPFLRHRYESVTLRKYFDFSIKERDILGRKYKIG